MITSYGVSLEYSAQPDYFDVSLITSMGYGVSLDYSLQTAKRWDYCRKSNDTIVL